MISPEKLTRFDRTQAELEEFWLFGIAVAGKPAFRVARQIDAFVRALPGSSPFAGIRQVLAAEGYAGLQGRVVAARVGQHTRITKAFAQSAELDVGTLNLDALMSVHGVGPKTARMFLLHSRPGQRYAVLDVHILKHLGRQGFHVPKVTPTGARYLKLEHVFLWLADDAGMTPADYDLHIWKQNAVQS